MSEDNPNIDELVEIAEDAVDLGLALLNETYFIPSERINLAGESFLVDRDLALSQAKALFEMAVMYRGSESDYDLLENIEDPEFEIGVKTREEIAEMAFDLSISIGSLNFDEGYERFTERDVFVRIDADITDRQTSVLEDIFVTNRGNAEDYKERARTRTSIGFAEKNPRILRLAMQDYYSAIKQEPNPEYYNDLATCIWFLTSYLTSKKNRRKHLLKGIYSVTKAIELRINPDGDDFDIRAKLKCSLANEEGSVELLESALKDADKAVELAKEYDVVSAHYTRAYARKEYALRIFDDQHKKISVLKQALKEINLSLNFGENVDALYLKASILREMSESALITDDKKRFRQEAIFVLRSVYCIDKDPETLEEIKELEK